MIVANPKERKKEIKKERKTERKKDRQKDKKTERKKERKKICFVFLGCLSPGSQNGGLKWGKSIDKEVLFFVKLLLPR